SVTLNVCSAFYASNERTLKTYYKLGSLEWVTTGGAIDPKHFGYPQVCFGPSSSLFLSYYILTLGYAPPGCTPASNYDCAIGSYAQYESRSTTGTTTSVEKSVANNLVLNATLGVDPADPLVSGGFGWRSTDTSGSSTTITKETSE